MLSQGTWADQHGKIYAVIGLPHDWLSWFAKNRVPGSEQLTPQHFFDSFSEDCYLKVDSMSTVINTSKPRSYPAHSENYPLSVCTESNCQLTSFLGNLTKVTLSYPNTPLQTQRKN